MDVLPGTNDSRRERVCNVWRGRINASIALCLIVYLSLLFPFTKGGGVNYGKTFEMSQ